MANIKALNISADITVGEEGEYMAIKIYVRERLKVGSGVKEPKFRVIAVTGSAKDNAYLKIKATHFRKVEIEQIAKDLGAKMVYLKPVPVDERGKMK